MRPFVFTRAEAKLRRKLRFRRWYLRNSETQRARSRTFHATHRALSLARSRSWRKRHPDRVRALARRWAYRKPEKARGYRAKTLRARRLRSPVVVLTSQLRCRINVALKKSGCRKSAKTCELIGCSVPELRVHLQKQFQTGMSWENRTLWHIDHKKPCAAFDLSDPAQQRECFHFSNLQPLWAGDNCKKGARPWKDT